MAKTIDQGFSTLSTRLNISGLQAATVSTRQTNVRDAVGKGMTVSSSFLTGSYRRSTLIAPLKEADVDIFVVLDPKYHPSGARNVLEQVKSALLKTYETPKVSRNGQAITITFTDFAVDVVPAFNRKGGGYLIPNSGSNTWISTDPTVHVELSADANKAHDGDLVPVIKMIKAWNRNIGRHFRSFHLEVLTWEIFTKVTISSHPSGVRFFFDKARALIPKKQLDPAGYGGDVGAYINNQQKIDDAVSRLNTALTRAQKAEAFARDGKIESAFGEWQKIFGTGTNGFPAYG